MKEIRLTRGMKTLVDDSDFEYLCKWKWMAHNRNGKFYAARGDYEKLGFKKYRTNTVSMHRVIMNAPKDKEVDHINSDSLDNRRVNLRLTDRFGNNQNALLRRDSSSGYKGVSFYKAGNKWVAYIGGKGRKSQHIGYFPTIKEAAHAYNLKAKELFGEFAKENLL